MKSGKFARALSATAIAALSVAAPKTALASGDPYVGEIMIFAGNFCPRNYAEANGALLAINQNDALFSLYGTMYGGDGVTTFGLPDLRGRAPIHFGNGPGLSNYSIGQKGGSTSFNITLANLPNHNHDANVTNATADKHGPGTDFLAPTFYADGTTKLNIYHEGPPDRAMDPGVIGNTGGSQPYSKRSPALGIKICVALYGVYPSRN